MSLFDKITEGATTCADDIGSTLRSALLLASRLGYEPFRLWVNSELSGYSGDADLPAYRTVSTSITYKAVSGWTTQSGTATFEFFYEDEKAHEAASRLGLRVSAVELASWARKSDDVQVLPSPYVQHAVAQHVQKQGFDLLSSRQVIAEAAVERVLSDICVALLNFVLEIEKQFPEVAEKPLNQTPEAARALGSVFNQVIVNGGNSTFSMAAGTAPVATTVAIEQKVSDANQLTRFLRDEGLEINDLAEVIEDATVEDIDQPDSVVGQWIEKLPEAGKAAGKIVLVEAIKHAVGQILTGQFDPSMLPMIFG